MSGDFAPARDGTSGSGGANPQPLLVDVEEGLAWVTLNRPAVLNALDLELMGELTSVLGRLAVEPGVRCVGLRGSGRAFCAGGDLELIRRRREDVARAPSIGTALDRQHRALVHHAHAALLLREMPKPTIAAVHGHAVGGGLALALACDVRIVAEDATLRTGFAARSLSGDFGISYLLVRAVGPAKARELMLLDPVIDGREAARLGLASEACEASGLGERAAAVAGRLAGGPTIALGRMKDNLLAAETSSFEQLLQIESLNLRVSGNTADAAEAARAWVERRPPAFTGA